MKTDKAPWAGRLANVNYDDIVAKNNRETLEPVGNILGRVLLPALDRMYFRTRQREARRRVA